MLAFVKKVVSINPNFEKNLIKYLRMNTQSGNRRLTLSPTEKEKHLFFNDYVYKNEIMDHRANIYLSRIKED